MSSTAIGQRQPRVQLLLRNFVAHTLYSAHLGWKKQLREDLPSSLPIVTSPFFHPPSGDPDRRVSCFGLFFLPLTPLSADVQPLVSEDEGRSYPSWSNRSAYPSSVLVVVEDLPRVRPLTDELVEEVLGLDSRLTGRRP